MEPSSSLVVVSLDPTAASATPPTTATIANPSPPALNNHNHPPYAEMIYAAIGGLKERNGSSKRAVAKYIAKAYTNLPPNHSALLTHHLKRLKNTGHIVMVKKSYKFPRSDADASNNVNVNDNTTGGPKSGRRPGRPPKSKTIVSVPIDQLPNHPEVGQPKRRPGRPKKITGLLPVVVTQSLSLPKRRAGRPRKNVTGAEPVVSPFPLPRRSPGRPRKPKAIPMSNAPRPRGRPKKLSTSSAAVTAIVIPSTTTSGQRMDQGRQQKNSTGRPVGRPKKNVELAANAPGQQEVVIEDLKRKLEFFQSKVKLAVGLLKPQLSSDSEISTVAAIRELEGLASMDISTPMKEEAHPLPPRVLQS